jgi:hypothetical protein
MRYMSNPQVKTTLGTETFTNAEVASAEIILIENGFDTATITVNDYQSKLYPATVTVNTAQQIDVKDASEVAWTTISKGVVRIPNLPLPGDIEALILKCDGAGYGFGDTVCAEEYGAQSKHPTLDTVVEILTDANYGLVPKFVNKVVGSATNSGFAYTTSIEAITGSIPYQYYPYKPNSKCLDDLCDLVTAIKAGSAGPHWRVGTDDTLYVKLITTSVAGWSKYYGGSAAESTLEQGIDFTDGNFEHMGPEANYIIYYGSWRRPSNGDFWTENNAASWTGTDCTVADDTSAGDYKVNTASVAFTRTHVVNIPQMAYPSTLDWNLDLSSAKFKEHNIPSLNVWLKRSGVANGGWIDLVDGAGNYFRHNFSAEVPDANRWCHISVPVGDYSNSAAVNWTKSGAADWADIHYISVVGGTANGETLWIDGLHFGDASVCRIAKNTTSIAADKLKVKLITDDIGKDDTLTSGTPGTTDLGLMAQMAYAELLRLQKTSIVGTVTVPMIKDALPGEWFHIHAKKTLSGSFQIDKDFRATKITHKINADLTSTLELTDDLTNSHSRPAYESPNKFWASIRPEFQDRQASSVKARDVDIRIAPLEEDYA